MAAHLTNGATSIANGGSEPADMIDGANFDELVEAYFALKLATDPSAIAALKKEFSRVEKAFELRNGEVLQRWFGGTIRKSAVVLTANGELHLTLPFDSPYAADLCFSALAIQDDARRVGATQLPLVGHRDASEGVTTTSGSLLYAAVLSLLQTLDAGKAVGVDTRKIVSRQLDKARDVYLARRKRWARMSYATGVVAGAFVIFLISLLTYWVLPKLISHLVAPQDLPHVVEMFTACLNAGGAGALLSVLMRMSSDSLRIKDDESFFVLFVVGGFRPVIGGVSGVAVYVLYKAQLLPLQVPSGGTDFFTFGGLAFLAGFSERLAQDALMQTDRKAFGPNKAA
jgi:hypothetical protein